MKNLLDKLDQLNGEELRDLHKKVEIVKIGNVAIAGPVSDDYEQYQLKNKPNTVDIAVTIVMGAPFPTDFRSSMKNLLAKLECIFEPYDIALRMYAEERFHATVSPIVRTTFDPDKYLKDPDTMNKIQRHEILNRQLRLQEVKEKVCCTQPFSIEVCPWDIRIGKRGEILLWGSVTNDKGKKELQGLRKRLKSIAGSHARDKGPKVHIALATIKDFHKLTGLQKKDIALKLNSELKYISCPKSILIDRVKLIRYLHRSLSKVESLEEICFC